MPVGQLRGKSQWGEHVSLQLRKIWAGGDQSTEMTPELLETDETVRERGQNGKRRQPGAEPGGTQHVRDRREEEPEKEQVSRQTLRVGPRAEERVSQGGTDHQALDAL